MKERQHARARDPHRNGAEAPGDTEVSGPESGAAPTSPTLKACPGSGWHFL